jgi:hypothetical protein
MGGPRPQPPGQGVPQHLGASLIATRAHRLAQLGIVGVVALPAAGPAAVRAPLALPVGMARVDQQPLRPAGVHRTEGGGGEGDEQPRMPAHHLGDALAAPHAGGEQVELVGLVGGRAGGAHGGPAVAAGLQERVVRLPLRVIDGADLTGITVCVVDGAAQPHRMGAVAGLSDLLHPAVIARTGPSDGLGRHSGKTSPTRTGSVMLAYRTCGRRPTWGWSPWRIGSVESRCRQDV